MKRIDLYNKSRVMGDYQARYCEKLGVKLPLLTRPANRYTPFYNPHILAIAILKQTFKRKMRQQRVLRNYFRANLYRQT
jgi:hypothetical protein